jgi:HK97 family phage prohead protease
MEEGHFNTILGVLGARIGLDPADIPEGRVREADKRDIYSVTDSGIAVIDIAGALVNRQLQGVQAMSGLTSYEEIAAEVTKAATDSAVRGIMMRINSGGGEVAGITTLANLIRETSKIKPVWASVDDQAFSAAYWIASAANRIYVTDTSGVGSVGVIAKHVDKTKLNENVGLKITTVRAGAKKASMSDPDTPLSAEALADLEARVEEVRGMFVETVASNRGLSKKAVLSTEAGLLWGKDGIDAGFADKMGSFPVAMAEMEAMLRRGKREDMAPAVITDRKSEKRSECIEERQLAMGEIRAAGTESEPLITGHIAVFGQLSIEIGNFRERVMPGAFAKSLKEADIHHYFNHDTNIVLGRNKSGTLRLKEDDQGLHIENDPPNTQTVRDLVLEPIRRGDIDQGSFSFVPVKQEWSRVDGQLIRTLHEVKLYHTSIVPKGAYPQTDIVARDKMLRAVASASGIDLMALATVTGKCQYDLALSDEENAFLQDTLRRIESMSPVTPGALAAHLTESEPKPLRVSPALRNRLELLRRRVAV